MPPRHGKSELASKYLPAWFLGTFPRKRVILASYEASFAESWGRKARDILKARAAWFGVKVKDSPSAANNWEIEEHEGGMVTAGVGGPITGKGADLLIVDDPIKNAEEAASKTIRDKNWDWWQSTAYTRLEPDGVAIVIQTRWHEDDLTGRLLTEAANDGEQWRVLKLPAIGHDGAALWPERFTAARLLEIKRVLGSYFFSALYQQEPTPEGGGFFKRESFTIVDELPAECSRLVRFWDKAGSSTDGDWSVGGLMGAHQGLWYVADIVRGRWSPFERNRVMLQTAELDALRFGPKVELWVEQEPGNGGKESAQITQRELARFGVRIDKPHDDKTIRARPFAAAVEAGNVRLVRGPWNSLYLDELVLFPNGAHDDQCLVAGTAIETARGLIPIEDVTEGDRVITRYGWMQVEVAGQTGTGNIWRVETCDGHTLEGTAKHPVYIHNRGFTTIDAISGDDKILVWKPHQKPSFTTDESFAVTQTQRGVPIGFTSSRTRVGRKRRSIFTAFCGKRRTARYQKGLSFTTRMAIRSITQSTILNASAVYNMFASTQIAATSRLRKLSRISTESDHWLQNGTHPKRAEHGIGCTQSELQNSRSLTSRAFVPCAAKSLCQNAERKLAAVNAETPFVNDCRRMSEHANTVHDHLCAKGEQGDFVPVRVRRVFDTGKTAAVYNLAVAEHHEYVANGMLVHNCDASSGAFNKLVLQRVQPRAALPTAYVPGRR